MPVKKNHYAEFPDNPNELSESVRLQMAHNDYLDYNTNKKTKSIRKCAREYGITYETLRDRINRAKPKEQDIAARQRLLGRQEAVIKRYIRKLEVWGWPPIIYKVHCIIANSVNI
jgi:lambda repressor-like predicted transcriptional regulator